MDKLVQAKDEKINTATSYLKDQARILWGVRQTRSNQLPAHHPDKIDTLEKFFSVIQHACEDINGEERRHNEYYSLCQTDPARDYAYALLRRPVSVVEARITCSINVQKDLVLEAINVTNTHPIHDSTLIHVPAPEAKNRAATYLANTALNLGFSMKHRAMQLVQRSRREK